MPVPSSDAIWTARISETGRTCVTRFEIVHDDRVLTYREVLRRWAEEAPRDGCLAGWFCDLLAASPFSAFRWETPPISSSTADRAFEFVLIDSPGLARPAQPDAFAEHFDARPDADVLSFANLGGDAVMVVPAPRAEGDAYGHLAAFLRRAPRPQRLALWAEVARAALERLGSAPLWISTAGAGVAWLHVRIDDHPKYYGFDPYCDPDTG